MASNHKNVCFAFKYLCITLICYVHLILVFCRFYNKKLSYWPRKPGGYLIFLYLAMFKPAALISLDFRLIPFTNLAC